MPITSLEQSPGTLELVETLPPVLDIAPLEATDWPLVRRIYEEGLKTQVASFDTEIPPFATWDQEVSPLCRLVAKKDGHIVAWTALRDISRRRYLAGVAEVHLYVDERYRQKGVGSLLLAHLVKESEQFFFWTLQATVMAKNHAARALFEKGGFRKVGYREKFARRDGQWHDVLLYERRSTRLGLD